MDRPDEDRAQCNPSSCRELTRCRTTQRFDTLTRVLFRLIDGLVMHFINRHELLYILVDAIKRKIFKETPISTTLTRPRKHLAKAPGILLHDTQEEIDRS